MQFDTIGEARDNHVKMITMKPNGWHFKLQKYVFKNAMRANPSSFKNLCPYFWMLIMAMFLAPFKAIYDIILWPFRAMINSIVKGMEVGIDEFFETLTEEHAYRLKIDIDEWYYLPKNIQNYLIEDKRGGAKGAFNEWCTRKFGNKPGKMSNKRYSSYKDFIKRLKAHREEQWALKQDIESARETKKENRRATIRKTHDWIDNIGDFLIGILDGIRNFFSFETPAQIIRWSKRLVGLIITSLISVGIYVVINLITYGVVYLIQNYNHEATMDALIGISFMLIAIAIGYLIGKLGEYISKKIKATEDNPWWIQILIYLFQAIWLPLKYTTLYLIWYPLYFLGYNIIYKFITISIIVGFFKSFWNAFMSGTGIFKEYLGSSYNDFCPGISWQDDDGNEVI